MNNNIYLNEENYKRSNKKVKLFGDIIILLSIGLIVLGVFTHIQASNVQVPNMGEPNWFEASKTKSEINFRGTTMIMFGGFLSAVGCMVRFAIGNAREITAYNIQTMMPVAQEGIKTMVPTMVEVQREMTPVYGEMAKEISKGIKEGLR